MKTIQKRIALLCLAALMLVSMLLVSCTPAAEDTTKKDDNTTTTPDAGGEKPDPTPGGEGEDETTTNTGGTVTPPAPTTYTYTITVTDTEGNPVEGLKLQFCSIDTGVCYLKFFTSNANGIITAEQSNPDGYKVKPTSVPTGYTLTGADADGYYFFDAGRTATIVLESAAAAQ